MRGAAWLLVTLVALCACSGAFVLPAWALIADAVRPVVGQWFDPPLPDAAGIGPRQIGLLWRGFYLAALATVGALVLGAGLATGLVAGRASVRGAIAAVCLWTLVTPTYLLAYSWGLFLLPEGSFSAGAGAPRISTWISREGRAVMCLATWLAPLAALMMASAWGAQAVSLYRLALLDTGPLRAVWVSACGAMRPALAAAALVCFLLASTDYAAAHLCQAYTWNTELLSELQALDRPALIAAWPLLLQSALTVAGLGVLERRPGPAAFPPASDAGSAWWCGPPCPQQSGAGLRARTTAIAGRSGAASELRAGSSRLRPPGSASLRLARPAVTLIAGLVLLAPAWLLLAHLRSSAALLTVWNTYRDDWLYALPIGGAAGVAAVAVAVFVCWMAGFRERILRWLGRLLLVLIVAAATAPPVVIGEGLLLGFARVPWLRDSFLVISLCGVARFAVIPLLALRASLRASREEAEQAQIDGAGWTATYLHVLLPQSARTLAVCGLICAVLAAGEIGAAQLVAPPGVNSLAKSMLNELHFGRDDQIIAMSLWMMAACAAAAGLVVLAFFARRASDRCQGLQSLVGATRHESAPHAGGRSRSPPR